MAAPIRIWLEISHHGPFRIGGWAWLRAADGALTGYAGGERRVDAERAALMALIAALKEPRSGPAELYTASPLIAAIPGRIAAAQAGEDPPTDNLDLWAQAMTALASPAVAVRGAVAERGGPAAFTAGWAEFARDRAKDKGPFTSAIPKPNLAKAGVAPA